MVADTLYHYSDTTEKYFWRIAKALTEKGIDKTQMKTLVLLGFFDEYGARKTILRVLDAMNLFKAGDRKTIPKLQVDGVEYLQDIVKRYGVGHNDKGEQLKTYRLTDTYAILDACEDTLRGMPVEDFDFKNKIATQMQYLGFVSLQTNQESDRPKLFVRGVYPVCRKSDGAQFGFSILTRSIGSGIESRFTVFNRVFDKELIHSGDIIKCLGYTPQGKYFTMERYEHIFS